MSHTPQFEHISDKYRSSRNSGFATLYLKVAFMLVLTQGIQGETKMKPGLSFETDVV